MKLLSLSNGDNNTINQGLIQVKLPELVDLAFYMMKINKILIEKIWYQAKGIRVKFGDD
jgi:hypothetical protein